MRKNKSGEAVIAICIAVSIVAGLFFAKGGKVYTRAFVMDNTMTGCTNCTNVFIMSTNSLNVEGGGTLKAGGVK
jgi:hypothetical protein